MEHSNPSYIKILVSYYQIFISVKPTICLFNFKPIFVQLFIKINSYGRKLENEVGLQTRTNGGEQLFWVSTLAKVRATQAKTLR